MSQFNLSYREVIPDQSTLATAKEITLSTGITFFLALKSNLRLYLRYSRRHTKYFTRY